MEKNRKPNILFILSDQHRFCDVGFMGNDDVETLCLDRLASQGAYFSSMYSNCPVCVPARGTIFTGLHVLQHGAAANDLPVKEELDSMATILKQSGYQTAYIGKWHLGGTPRDQFISQERRLGYEFWNGYNCNHEYYNGYYDDNEDRRHPIEGYEPEGITERALHYLADETDEDRPWAMCLCYGTPHDPYYELPQEELEHFQEKDLKLRGNVSENWKEILWGETPDVRKMYAGYYGHIHMLDRQIQKMYDYLDTHQLLEDTVIVYTSDHGDMLGSQGYLNKQLYYNESARVPFVIYWKDKISGGERRQPLSLVDIIPTLAGLVGAEYPDFLHGSDQSAVVLDPMAEGQEAVYFYSYVPCHQASMRSPQSWRAAADAQYVYVVDEFGEPVAFYNNTEDPLQKNNLIHTDCCMEEKIRLKEWLDRQVHIYDGYQAWDRLLEEHGLFEKWEESQKYFGDLWHVQMVTRRAEFEEGQKMIRKMREKQLQ